MPRLRSIPFGEDGGRGAAERSEESRAEDREEDDEQGGDRSSLRRMLVGVRVLHCRRGNGSCFAARNPNPRFHEPKKKKREKAVLIPSVMVMHS